MLDPVDGTANALSGIPFYSVSLAVGKRDLDGVRFGLVRNLSTARRTTPQRERGRSTTASPIKVRDFKLDRAQFLVYLGNRAARQALGMAAIPRRTRSLGSTALETCIVAAGGADLHAVVVRPDQSGDSGSWTSRPPRWCSARRGASSTTRGAEVQHAVRHQGEEEHAGGRGPAGAGGVQMKVGVVANPDLPRSMPLVKRVMKFFAERKIETGD